MINLLNISYTKRRKSYQVVLKKLHHTTSIELITQELNDLGFSVGNVTNIKNIKQPSTPLPLFFIDLNPTPINPEIFKIMILCYSKIKIKELYSKLDLP